MRKIVPLLAEILVVILVAGCPTPNSSAKSSKKALTKFHFTTTANPALGTDVTGTINGQTITLTVPYRTDVTALKASFITTGTKVTIGDTAQASGTTSNDFTDAVTYTVTAEDGSTQDYTVTVTIAPKSAKEFTAFHFTTTANPALGTDVPGTINGQTITLTVPYRTDVTVLKASFTITGTKVTIGDTAQASGTTSNDFTDAVTYTVTAADGSTQDYTVTVTIAKNSGNKFTAFHFTTTANPALGTDVTGTISGESIALTVPFGVDIGKLVATFTVPPGASVIVDKISQISGTTLNNFVNVVIYTVTTADGSTQEYKVRVMQFLSSAKELTVFRFPVAANPALGTDVEGIITGTNIALTVPFGTDVTRLTASFITTGTKVTIGGTTQAKGTTSKDFSSAVICTVTAADGSTQDYTIMVTIATIAMEDTAFSQVSKTPGDFAFMTLGKSFEKQKMIYANSRASRTFPTGIKDDVEATLTHQFWMGETEVTNALFAAVYKWAYDNNKFSTTADSPNLLNTTTVKNGEQELFDLNNRNCHVKYDGSGGFSVESGYEEFPVTEVSWYGAIMFCNWLTEMRDGNTDNVVYGGMNDNWKDTETIEDMNRNGYRLPSSNEWEYTARYRGTDTTNTVSGYDNPWYTKGNSASGATTYYDDATAGGNTGDPGKSANDAVAVYERYWDGTTWVTTGIHDEVAVKSKAPNTLGLYDMSGNVYEWCFTRSSTSRVIRGGSWSNRASYLQMGEVGTNEPPLEDDSIGFRLCRTAN